MTSMRSFFSGFILGFGSGVAFRTLAENDFEPVKQIAKSAVGGLQKVGDALTDTYGRFREAMDDIKAEVAAERSVSRAKNRRMKVVHPKIVSRRKGAPKRTLVITNPAGLHS